MNWKETVLDSKKLKMETPKLTENDDGRADINIHIPLTDFLELQAKQSYAQGIMDALGFVADSKGVFDKEDVLKFIEDNGLPEIARVLRNGIVGDET